MLILVSLSVLISGFGPPSPSTGGLDQCYRDTYDLKYDKAHQCFADWEHAHPQDPMGPVSDAAVYLFSEFDRLKVLRFDFFKDNKSFLNRKKPTPDPRARQQFNKDLDEDQKLIKNALHRTPNDEQAQLANVLSLVLKSDYDALIDFRYSQALAEIKQATAKAKRLLAKHPDCYDANVAIGVENYLLSLKPAPERWFLRLTGAQTSKQRGLAKLGIVAQKGDYLKPYAKVLLAIAAVRDNDKQKARQLLSELAKEFPDNDLFQSELKRLT